MTMREKVAEIASRVARNLAKVPPVWRAKYMSDAVAQSVLAGGVWRERTPFDSRLLHIAHELKDFPIDAAASDIDICARAKLCAAECCRWCDVCRDDDARRERCELVLSRYGVEPIVWRNDRAVPTLKRYACELWWRRRLRAAHAKRVEGAAIVAGLVHARESAYLSKLSYRRWQGQQARNLQTLKRIAMCNEDTGEIATVQELAASSVANPMNRRGELMTRIRGMEEVAEREGHEALFVTITCPSRMHARLSKGGVENGRFDGTTPKEANAYLSAVWARARSSIKRAGVAMYGIRVAEPHHDGCPHWHLLLFVGAGQGSFGRVGSNVLVSGWAKCVHETIRRYALADSGDEPGADQYRVKVVKMDAGKGTAASYVAKYIAKGVGLMDDGDLFDAEAGEETRPRAWASTWRIRQFQFVGGPPVGLWRELRRVELSAIPLQGAPHRLVRAWTAAQRDGERKACWRSFVDACGGYAVTARTSLVQLVTVAVETANRYGEVKGVKPFGVACADCVVQSVRHAWAVVSSSWTRVNNCTREMLATMARAVENRGQSAMVPVRS
jgi:hypothetical protein